MSGEGNDGRRKGGRWREDPPDPGFPRRKNRQREEGREEAGVHSGGRGGEAVAEAEPPTFSVQVGHSGVSVLGRYVGVPQQAIQNEQGHARDVAVVLQSYELSINCLERN